MTIVTSRLRALELWRYSARDFITLNYMHVLGIGIVQNGDDSTEDDKRTIVHDRDRLHHATE